MKERLEELTVSQFVDLVCGNTSVLLGKHEFVAPEKLAKVTRNIVYEYKEIADTAGVRAYVRSSGDYIKAKMAVSLYAICKNMINLGEYDRVRDVLAETGLKSAKRLSDKRVAAEVSSRLERAKAEIAKADEARKNEEEPELSKVRSEFDGQTAALMAYFKFQIDTATMKATVYAHLVARHIREIKAKLAAAQRK